MSNMVPEPDMHALFSKGLRVVAPLAMVRAMLLCALFAGAMTGLPDSAEAQQIPSVVSPRVPFEAERERPRRDDVPEIAVPSLGGAAPPGAEEIVFTLRGVTVEGGSVYPQAEMAALWADDIGDEITLARIFDYADSLQQRYRDDGYVLTRVIVPAQTSADGIFSLRVIEGFIGNVVIDGDAGNNREIVQRFLDKLTAARPVRTIDLERYLLLVNDIPGVTAVGVLRPGKGAVGASELFVELKTKQVDGFFSVNNRGSRFGGPVRITTVGEVNGLLGLGDRLEGILFMTSQFREQQFFQLSYEVRPFTNGLVLKAFANYSPSHPGFTLEQARVATRSFRTGVQAEYPVIRSRALNVSVRGGFETIDSIVDAFDELPSPGPGFTGELNLSDDALRVMHVGADIDFTDQWNGDSTFTANLRQGFDIFTSEDADRQPSRPNGEADFTSVSVLATRLQPITDQIALFGSVTGQYAFDTLLSDEEFRIGGEQFGRGYNPSELSGEHGLAGSVELQYTGTSGYKVASTYQIYGFYDIGAVWNDDTGSNVRASLASAGLGVRTELLAGLVTALEYARPLTRDVSDGQGDGFGRVFFQVSSSF